MRFVVPELPAQPVFLVSCRPVLIQNTGTNPVIISDCVSLLLAHPTDAGFTLEPGNTLPELTSNVNGLYAACPEGTGTSEVEVIEQLQPDCTLYEIPRKKGFLERLLRL